MVFWHLSTDWGALVSCSLTCRAFLRSARRVIHERLHLAGPRMPPSITRLTRWCWIYNRRYFRVLSLADDVDLVQHTQHLIVDAGQVLTPRSLRPHLPSFQKYVWLTSLTLTRFDPTPFLPVLDQYFCHLSQSLRSLNLISPQGIPEATRDFVSVFRNLDDLEFNPVPKPRRSQRHQPSSRPPHWFTSLAGTLRVVNTDSQRASSLEPLLRFPGGLHFRSIQFACSGGIDATKIVEKCWSTLESVTYTFHCRESASFCEHCQSIVNCLCYVRDHIHGAQFQDLFESSRFRSSDRQSFLHFGRPPVLVGRGPQDHRITGVLQVHIVTGPNGIRAASPPTRTCEDRPSRSVGVLARFSVRNAVCYQGGFAPPLASITGAVSSVCCERERDQI